MNKFLKNAFTLSEVLLVLGIIGVIASITTPVLINNVNSHKNMTMLKKLYSSYTVNIKTMLNSEYATSCDSLACLRRWGGAAGPHNGALADTRYFNINDECTQACLTDYFDADTSFPDNNISYNNRNLNASLYELPNGAAVLIYDYAGNCNTERGVQGGDATNVCSVLMFDTNGSKGPNAPCSDRFAFYISNRPYGVDASNIPENFLVPVGFAGDNNNSYRCTATIVSNGWKK